MFEPTTWTVPPPVSADNAEMRRQQHTRQRVKMLCGQHGDIVEDRVVDTVGHVRGAAWGKPDLSSNPFATSARALATLYDPELDEGEAFPTVSHPSDEGVGPALDHVLQASGIWPLMSRVQAQTLGLREMLVRVDVDGLDDEGRPLLCYRPVTPDLVEAVPDKRNPSRPVEIRELRFRKDPLTGNEEWTRELWSVAGGVGRHQVLDEAGRDISARWGLPEGGQVGDAYPALRSDGRPVLPYVLHHAELTGSLWDAWTGIEVVEGTLTCNVGWTMLGHILRNAAFSWRYTLNAMLAGLQTVDPKSAAARQVAISDPAVVHPLQRIDEDKDAEIGQLEPSADPQKWSEALASYERRLHSSAGLDPADAARVSGDPRSGYALEISRKSKEASALRYAPVFARADAEMVGLTAILYNRAARLQVFPESGWQVEHAPIRAIRRRALAAASTASSAFNGAQVESMTAVIQQVAARQLPRDSGVAILARAFGVSTDDADAMLGSVGRTFFAAQAA